MDDVDGVVDGKSLQKEGGEEGCFPVRLPLPTSSIHDDDDI